MIPRNAKSERSHSELTRFAFIQTPLQSMAASAPDARSLSGGKVVPMFVRHPQRLPLMSDRAMSPMPLRVRPAFWVGAGIVGALAGGTALLWAHYGSAVFFETIIAGLSFCF
jgi:hypothetical protein